MGWQHMWNNWRHNESHWAWQRLCGSEPSVSLGNIQSYCLYQRLKEHASSWASLTFWFAFWHVIWSLRLKNSVLPKGPQLDHENRFTLCHEPTPTVKPRIPLQLPTPTPWSIPSISLILSGGRTVVYIDEYDALPNMAVDPGLELLSNRIESNSTKVRFDSIRQYLIKENSIKIR
jgi:hypothetical protein